MPKGFWTIEEMEILRENSDLLNRGIWLPSVELAQMLGRNVQSINNKRYRLGLRKKLPSSYLYSSR